MALSALFNAADALIPPGRTEGGADPARNPPIRRPPDATVITAFIAQFKPSTGISSPVSVFCGKHAFTV